MKLATYKDSSRDGQLVVVSNDLCSAHYASGIATRLQQVLDDWNFLSPQLEDLARTLNHGKARHAFAFDARMCMAPLPRAYQWADASAYLSHMERVRRARGATLPENARTEAAMYQGGSDAFLGPRDDIVCVSEEHGIDFEAELAVITGDAPLGCNAQHGLASVRLLMLANDVTLRHLVPAELAQGLGFVQSKPATAFSPVAVTPEELGPTWQDGRIHGIVQTRWNERVVGRCESGPEMAFHFGELIAHLCKTRELRAGSIVGSGTVSNLDAARGCSCIAEIRALEIMEHGAASTEYMKFGDSVHIEMLGRSGQSVFGAIAQRVAQATTR